MATLDKKDRQEVLDNDWMKVEVCKYKYLIASKLKSSYWELSYYWADNYSTFFVLLWSLLYLLIFHIYYSSLTTKTLCDRNVL